MVDCVIIDNFILEIRENLVWSDIISNRVGVEFYVFYLIWG